MGARARTAPRVYAYVWDRLSRRCRQVVCQTEKDETFGQRKVGRKEEKKETEGEREREKERDSPVEIRLAISYTTATFM